MLRKAFRKCTSGGRIQLLLLAGVLLLVSILSVTSSGGRHWTHFTWLLLVCTASVTSTLVLAAHRFISSDIFRTTPPASSAVFYQFFSNELSRIVNCYSVHTYFLALIPVFFDGAPENLQGAAHIVGGTDWRLWLAFCVLLVICQPLNKDDLFDVACWVLLAVPAALYWLIHAAWLPSRLCWDFVLGDLLARTSIILSQSYHQNWRLKFAIGLAVLTLLRLNTYHCDLRIARSRPVPSPASRLVGADSQCLAVQVTSRWRPVAECWLEGSHCYRGLFRHDLKHGEGRLTGILHTHGANASMRGEWRNGLPNGEHTLEPFGDRSYWLGGQCINGTCVQSHRRATYRRRASVLLLQDWTVEDVAAWLDEIRMPPRYKAAFTQEAISGKELNTPQLLDEEYLLLLNVSAGDSVRIANSIYKMQQTYKEHQRELSLLAEGVLAPACSLTAPCLFFGNVYPKVRRMLLASLNLPSKSIVFDAVWHVVEMVEQVRFSPGVPHTIVHSRPRESTHLLLLKEWSRRFHSTWPTGLLTEKTVLKALGVDEAVFIGFFHHFSGELWPGKDLRWYLVLLMDLDDNNAIDFTEFCLFVRAYSHFYPLQQRTTHRRALADLLPVNLNVNSVTMERLLFHTLRLAQEQAVLGNDACRKHCAAFTFVSVKSSEAAELFRQTRGTYYGYDAKAN